MARMVVAVFISVSLSVLVMSCGGGGSSGGGADGGVAEAVTGAEIESVTITDSDGSSVENSGSTVSNPETFEVTIVLNGVSTYSVTEVGQLVTAGREGDLVFGAISLTCGDMTADISVEQSEAGENSYTVTVEDAWKYGAMDCTLAVETLEGTEYPASRQSFSFHTACAVSDDFNAQTISDSDESCWGIVGYSNTLNTWADMTGIIGIDPAESVLDVDFSGRVSDSVGFSKDLSSIAGDDFEMVLYIKPAADMPVNSGINLTLKKIDSVLLTMPYIVRFGTYIRYMQFTPTLNCAVLAGGESSLYEADCSGGYGYYVRLAKSGGTFFRQYKAEGGEYTDLEWNASTPAWEEQDLSGSWRLVLTISGSSDGGGDFQIGYVRVRGMTVDGQY